MAFGRVALAGLGYVDAPEVVPSAAIEAWLEPAMGRLGMGRGLLRALTGIEERRFFPADVTPSMAALEAARRAIAEAGISRGEIGLLVSTSVCKDFIEPSVASLVHGELGLGAHCLNFDIGNACLGFLSGMQLAGEMIERGAIDYALVVDGENARHVVERTVARLNEPGVTMESFRSQIATLTLGSGAAAMVLGRTDRVRERAAQAAASRPGEVVDAVALAATEHRGLCRGQVDGMETDAAALLQAGVALASDTFALARQRMGWTPQGLDVVIAHQVSSVHTARVAEVLGVSLDRIFKIYPHFGNMGPAAIPIALAKSREAGWLWANPQGPRQRVGLMGIGSGLNCMMMEMLF